MNTFKFKVLWCLAATIILAIAASYLLKPFLQLELPNSAQYSSEPLETRQYRRIVSPKNDEDFSAKLNRNLWRLTQPGQSAFIASVAKHGGGDQQSALVDMGYVFTDGTYAATFCNGIQIRHHSSVLNDIERRLDLVRIHP